MDEKQYQKGSMKTTISDCADALTRIKEEQDGINTDEILAEVFQEVKDSPEAFTVEHGSSYTVTYAPKESESSPVWKQSIQNYSGSVKIYSYEYPKFKRYPLNFLSPFFKKRKVVKMVTPIPTVLSSEQQATFYELVEGLKRYKLQTRLKEQVEAFRESKRLTNGSQVSLDGFISLPASSTTATTFPPPPTIGDRRVNASGTLEEFNGISWIKAPPF